MVISIIGLCLGIAISALWIFLPQKKVPTENRLSKGVYIRSVLLGATLCTACIIIPELLWDSLTGINAAAVKNVGEAFTTSFLRAALIEEVVKFLFVMLVLKKHKPSDRLQYMLLAGTIGMGYSLIEKFMLAPGAVFFSALFSTHIMFQFIMGGFLYEAGQAATASEKRRKTFLAFLIPFVIHGTWDVMLFITELWVNSTSWTNVLGVILFIVQLATGIFIEVIMIQYFRKLSVGNTSAGEALTEPSDE